MFWGQTGLLAHTLAFRYDGGTSFLFYVLPHVGCSWTTHLFNPTCVNELAIQHITQQLPPPHMRVVLLIFVEPVAIALWEYEGDVQDACFSSASGIVY